MAIKFYIYSLQLFFFGRHIKKLKKRLNSLSATENLSAKKHIRCSEKYQKTVRKFLTVSQKTILLQQPFQGETQP